MRNLCLGMLWLLTLAAGAANADLKVMIGVDPSDRESMLISLSDMEATLSKAAGVPVRAVKSKDLGDVMRSTRTGEYDMYIAPAHVAASALAHGYALLGSTESDETYELVVRRGVRTPRGSQGRQALPHAAGLGGRVYGAGHAERGRAVAQDVPAGATTARRRAPGCSRSIPRWSTQPWPSAPTSKPG